MFQHHLHHPHHHPLPPTHPGQHFPAAPHAQQQAHHLAMQAQRAAAGEALHTDQRHHPLPGLLASAPNAAVLLGALLQLVLARLLWREPDH